jgi:hypothetical protein
MKKIKCQCPHDGKVFYGRLIKETEHKFIMAIGKYGIEMHFPKSTHTYTVLENK